MLKAEKVSEIVVPRYKELSVESIWPLVKCAEDLYSHFPDYSANQLPDRRFMYAILGTLRGEVLARMVNDARKQRSVSQNQEANHLVYIELKFLTEIKSVMNQKGNGLLIINDISNKRQSCLSIKEICKVAIR